MRAKTSLYNHRHLFKRIHHVQLRELCTILLTMRSKFTSPATHNNLGLYTLKLQESVEYLESAVKPSHAK